METYKIVGLVIIGLWLCAVSSYVFCWIKTRTWPFDDEDDNDRKESD